VTLSIVLLRFFLRHPCRKSQTIDSGSSHYSTLFKEHPQHGTQCPCTVPFTHSSTQRLPAIFIVSLYRDGQTGFFLGILQPITSAHQTVPKDRFAGRRI